MEGPQVTTEPSGMNVLVGPLAIMSKPVNQAAPATEFFPVQRSRQGSARRILTRVPRNDGRHLRRFGSGTRDTGGGRSGTWRYLYHRRLAL